LQNRPFSMQFRAALCQHSAKAASVAGWRWQQGADRKGPAHERSRDKHRVFSPWQQIGIVQRIVQTPAFLTLERRSDDQIRHLNQIA